MSTMLRVEAERSDAGWAARAIVVAGAASAALAQSNVDQTYPLPGPFELQAAKPLRDHLPHDLALVDVFVGDGDDIRLVFTTEGLLTEELPTGIHTVHPGNLRFIDIALAPVVPGGPAEKIPDLAVSTFNGVTTTLAPVAHWNDVLIDPANGGTEEDPRHGKGISFQGIVSVNGTLYVGGEIRKDKVNITPPGPSDHDPSQHHTLWNGLSQVDGTATPALAFDPLGTPPKGQELWSAGTAGLGGPPQFQECVPETIAWTRNGLGRYLFCSNYCGKDKAGFLLVQNISNQLAVDASDRMLVDLYWLLGVYADARSTWPASAGLPFGAEVSSSRFTQSPWLIPYDVRGNKLRPVHAFAVPNQPQYGNNAGRRFLVAGLNLDPVNLETLAALDKPAGSPTDPTLDDGKYDYLAFVDITDMRPDLYGLPPGGGSWYFRDPNQWAQRTTFLRLPPDVPAGWFQGNPSNPPLQPGDDFSFVSVSNPNVGGSPSSKSELIAGSGTPTSLASDPSGRYVYLLSVDQGEGYWPAEPWDHDGGWHVPHLYVLDMTAFDARDQTSMDAYAASGQIRTRRFNKVVRSQFLMQSGPSGSEVHGAICVSSTLDNFPHTASPTWPTRLLGAATPAQIGSFYPGEHQFDPTPWTRLQVVRHPTGLVEDRMYVGANAKWQSSTLDAEVWPYAGALFSLSLADPAEPRWVRTIVFDKEGTVENPITFRISGLEIIPSTAAYLEGPLNRYVYAAIIKDAREDPLTLNGELNRFVLGQDGP